MVAPRRIKHLVAMLANAAGAVIGSRRRSYKFNQAKNSCYINTLVFR